MSEALESFQKLPSTGTLGEREGVAELRQIHGKHLRSARTERGMSRRVLSGRTGIHQSQIAKWELGLANNTTEERARALVEALNVELEYLSSPIDRRPPIVEWAERRAPPVGRKYAAQLASAGRIQGARKGPWPGFSEEVWIVKPDAPLLPPTEAQREKWRRDWHQSNKAEKQRERRAHQREEGSGNAGDENG